MNPLTQITVAIIRIALIALAFAVIEHKLYQRKFARMKKDADKKAGKNTIEIIK